MRIDLNLNPVVGGKVRVMCKSYRQATKKKAKLERAYPDSCYLIGQDTKTITGTIDEVRAVEQAVFLILNVERYEWLIYSWNYGFEKKSLIGKPVDFCIPEIERRVKEALLQDDRITAVENFQFEVNKKKVLTTFTVISIFGPIFTEMEVET